jgi:DNA-binding MarR family transcriptional regulator
MEERDHIDRFLETVTDLPIDPAVEGIVDRITGLGRRLRRMNDETLAEHGLSYADFKALNYLWHAAREGPLSAGKLAERLELSSGSMTARLDSLERPGLVRRVPDPADRRGVLVELTDEGRQAYTRAVEAQAQKESVVAAALTAREKKELNALLRRLMLEFERRESASGSR